MQETLCLNPVTMESVGEKEAIPNNQSCTEKWGGHYSNFIWSYAPLITQRYWQVKNFSAMNPCCFRKSQWEAISCYHKSTCCIVSKKNWNKGGQRLHCDACYVAAAIGEKAHLSGQSDIEQWRDQTHSVERVWVDLKIFLGLAMPDQYRMFLG